MKDKAMVWCVRTGVTLVSVPVEFNGAPLQCVFITRQGELARVGIFDASPRDAGPFLIFERYAQKNIPVAVIREARARAQAALDEMEPSREREPERETCFAFAADVAS